MRATISGQAGMAVVHADSDVILYSIDDLGAPRTIQSCQIDALLRGATDLQSVEIREPGAAVSLLMDAWSCDRLLQMLLILLRRDASSDLRAGAAYVAEELFANREARRFALNRLYSHPMTEDGDLDGAILFARQIGAMVTRDELEQLRRQQPVIAVIGAAWETGIAAVPGERTRLRRLFERNDVFHAIVTAPQPEFPMALLISRQPSLGEGTAKAMLQLLADARKRVENRAAEDPRSDAERTYLEHLPTIDRIASFVARRNHLSESDTEEFVEHVRVRLFEEAYALIRKFEGRSTFTTYLTTVITRIYHQYRVEQWGKWRPSAEAKRIGDKAIILERLLTRDGYSFEEAVKVLTTPAGSQFTVKELEAIYLRITPRHPRPVLVSDEMPSEPIAAEMDPAEPLLMRDREQTAIRIASAVQEMLASMEKEDRLILQLRFWNGMKVPDIAQRLRMDQKKLYKRMDRLFRTMRQAMEKNGLRPDDVNELIGRGDVEIVIDFDKKEKGGSPAATDHLIQSVYDRWTTSH